LYNCIDDNIFQNHIRVSKQYMILLSIQFCNLTDRIEQRLITES